MSFRGCSRRCEGTRRGSLGTRREWKVRLLLRLSVSKGYHVWDFPTTYFATTFAKEIKAVEDTAGWPLALPQRLYEQRRTVHDEHCSAGSHCSRVSTVLVVRYLPSERRQNSSTLASIALPRAQYFRRRRRPLLPRRLSLLAFLD